MMNDPETGERAADALNTFLKGLPEALDRQARTERAIGLLLGALEGVSWQMNDNERKSAEKVLVEARTLLEVEKKSA